MIVTLTDHGKRREIMTKAKTLKTSTQFKDVFIEPDMTTAEREEQYQLRQKLRKTRADNPDKDFRIKSGQIIEVK